MDFEFSPYTQSRKPDVLHFIAANSLMPYGESHAKPFLDQLVPDERKVLDLWVSGKRALVAAVLDTSENADNTAELTFIGWDKRVPLDNTCLDQIFRWAENHFRQGPRSGLDVIACDGYYPFTSKWLKARKYPFAFASYWMECPLSEFLAKAPPTSGVWKEVTEANARAYFELSRDVFQGQREVNFVPFELFKEMALQSSPRPQILVVEGAVVAFVKVKAVSEARGEIVSVGRASQWRGKGLGEIALYKGVSLLADLGMSSLELTVLASNRNAVTLYERHGFKRTLVFDTHRLE